MDEFNAPLDSLNMFPRTEGETRMNWAKVQDFMERVRADVRTLEAVPATTAMTYGGLYLVSADYAGDSTWRQLEFDSAHEATNDVTLTTGASAKITIQSAGDYSVRWSGVFGTELTVELDFSIRIKRNGSVVATAVTASHTFAIHATIEGDITVEPCLYIDELLTLAANDELIVETSATVSSDSIELNTSGADEVAAAAAGTDYTVSYSRFVVQQLSVA